ncbi:unnamed protein product [Effrenium voratum]|nr:unnamed protein product [Effrenium voratum]
MSMAAAGVLLAGTCPLSFRLENVAAALLSSNAALCFLTSMALSSWCGMRMRPWVSELLYNLTGGEAAIAPHYLEILPGPGAICFALAGTSGFLGALMLGVQEENGRTPTRESEASPKLRSPKIRKDGLVQLVARSRRELVREQQRWADTLLMGCAACFAVLLLASLWVVGQKTVDLGVKDALNKPTWRRRHGDLPWRQNYREAWRDVKAASICTGIRTAIKIDDFRKSVQQKADETALQMRGSWRQKQQKENAVTSIVASSPFRLPTEEMGVSVPGGTNTLSRKF